MTRTPPSVSADLWKQVEAEKKKDRRVRHVSIAAWTVTGLAIACYGAIIFGQFLQYRGLVEAGMAPAGQEWTAFTPLIAVVGVVALFVAVLATVGMFFRLRTSSLEELKVRLGALEEIVLEHVQSGD